MTGSNHPGSETLQDWMDGRLTAREGESVERHLRTCDRCSDELGRLRWAQEALRKAEDVEPAPQGLVARLGAALDEEDAAEAPPHVARWPLWAGLAAAVLLIGLAVLWPFGGADLPGSLARDFADYRSGTLTLELASTDFGEVERYLDRKLDFDVHVYDLAMMEYLPEGGLAHEVGGRPSALFVYRGSGGRLLICQMFRGRVETLPVEEELRTNDGIEFRVYEREGKTVVAWQEGEVICVLVSDIPREEVIQLAFAKAVKVQNAALPVSSRPTASSWIVSVPS